MNEAAYEILNDTEFWARLEYAASGWFTASTEKELRRYSIDGFIPDCRKNSNKGVTVEGTAWVGEGPRNQYEYQFSALIPLKIARKVKEDFSITSINIDSEARRLEIILAVK